MVGPTAAILLQSVCTLYAGNAAAEPTSQDTGRIGNIEYSINVISGAAASRGITEKRYDGHNGGEEKSAAYTYHFEKSTLETIGISIVV